VMVDELPVERSGEVSMRVDEAGIAAIEIHRPPNNFFDAALIRELADVCDQASSVGARVILLSSEGKNFCAGAQFGASSGTDEADGALYQHAVRLFEQPLPIIAVVHGAAVGGGLGLALAADLRIASPAARFSANFARLGFHHGFGLTVTLPIVIGHRRALDLLYTGRRVSGEEAYRIGLCDRLSPSETLHADAFAFAGDIAGSAPLAVQSIRSTMRGDLADQVRTALIREKDEQDKLMKTADWREGVAAVHERRPARFHGR
jgi:2-(1,2-epoxy-1,2-dihydrophenyl)acetyl-CoA isomerase